MPSLDSAEGYAERQHRLDRTLTKPQGLKGDGFALHPVLFKSSLFSARTGAREVFDAATPVLVAEHSGHTAYYKGEELRQDDQRVLLALIQLRFDCLVSSAISFVPRVFVREVLRWSDCGSSVDKLRACLLRLSGARIYLDAKGGNCYSLITDYNITSGSAWSVWLSPRLVDMFALVRPTFISHKLRLSASDSLHSWLLQYLCADFARHEFNTADLRALSGHASYSQPAFNARMRTYLAKLQADGVLSSWTIKGPRLWVTRAS